MRLVGVRTLTCLLTAAFGSAALQPALAGEAGRLVTYERDGETSFAASLLPGADVASPEQVDVVVLFDTSASQQGAYREAALAALDALRDRLREGDRMQLMAVDLDARQLTTEFVGGASPAANEAVASLRAQAPLGSTDLALALQRSLEQFAAADSAQRVVIYIGDGVSMANMLDAGSLAPLVDQLREARVSVSSYAIGPQVDSQLLAVLANHTGGNLYVAEPLVWQDAAAGISDERATAENQRLAEQAGQVLAQWSQAAVLWPTRVTWSQLPGQTFPATFPPLRSDRDAIVIGQTPDGLPSSLDVQLEVAGPAGPQQLSWTLKPEASHDDLAFLADMAAYAERDGGLSLPTVGTAGLAEAARLIGARVDQLTMLAQRAVSMGDRGTAQRIVQAVLQSDPGNVQARTIQNVLDDPFGADFGAEEAVEAQGAAAAPATVPPAVAAPLAVPAVAAPAAVPAVRIQPAAPAAANVGEGDIILAQPAAPPVAEGEILLDGGMAPPALAAGDVMVGAPAGGAFLDAVEQERRVFLEMLQKQIRNTVIDARERMASQPREAIQDLKLALENVRKAPDLDPTRRAELEDQLQVAIKEGRRRMSVKDELDRQRQAERAAASEQKMLAEGLMRNIDREQQLMDRFNSLMDERRYVEAEEVAEIVEEIDPEGVTPRVAALWARHKRHDYLQQVARAARWRGAWETMYQIELAHIPQPDNPPIIYPDADVWEELTIRRKARYSAVDLKSQGKSEQRIYEALRQPLKAPFEYVETPLNIIVQELSEVYDLPIVFDRTALDAIAVSDETEVSISVRNITLRSALELMLKEVEDLTYIVDNEVLLITSEDEASQRLQVKVYPVADLVLPIQDLGITGGMGGMMGGGMGGMGGGMGGMGGGMGGMGGGMGGMGGGMGGMGGGGMFAVADDLDTPVVNPAEIPASPTALQEAETELDQDDSNPLRAASIAIDPNLAPSEFWDRHFQAKREDLKTVRLAVRALMKKGQYEHASALIEAALRHGQPQPWMYESLGIALELAGKPQADIERAIMSACDFATEPDQLLLIANYLSQLGLDARAVSVYRQVAKADPLHHEAYALGLRAAQRAQDLAGIQWATLGILEQAWPTEQDEIRRTALRVAKSTLDQLRETGPQEAYDSYEQRLNAALVRDCVVRVSWTGEADVDLIVEEPNGTVCSLRDPRTAAGGVCLGDGYAEYGASSGEGSSETYVCPKAFTGDYRVRVRKVWGDLVAGKVTVDVYRNYRGPNQQHERQHIEIAEEEDALVLFNLDQGRREQPIAEGQLLAAVDRQQAVSRAVLAQQLGSMFDPSIVPDRRNPGLGLRRQLALAAGGAVGFQPVITVLPEGTQYMATGVVSADRRYVRITVSPSFTGIGNVTTFTFAGAGQPVAGGGGNNGGGGQGGGNQGGGNQGGGNAGL